MGASEAIRAGAGGGGYLQAPYANEHAARLKDPDQYKRFRRENDKFGTGIHAIWGIKDEGGKEVVELQAIRFDASKFTEAQARAWLKDHDHHPIFFEPASPEKAEGAPAGELMLVEGEGGGPRVRGLAYSGGKMALPGWRHPVVVDLAGLQLPEAVPLLVNHENRTGSRVGMVRARIQGGTLVIEGEIVSSSGVAEGVVEQARAGADWQLSIGAEVLESELVTAERTLNGRVQKPPFYHVKRSILREVSILPVGADGSTALRIAARLHLSGGGTMTFEKWLEAMGFRLEDLSDQQKGALKAKWDVESTAKEKDKSDGKQADESEKPKDLRGRARDTEPEASDSAKSGEAKAVKATREAVATEERRIADVQKLCATYDGKLEAQALAGIRAKAIEDGWDTRDTELALLRAERPKAPSIKTAQDEGGPKIVEAALCLGTGLSEECVAKAYGEPVLTSTRKRYGGPIGAGMFVLELAWANGFTDRRVHSGNVGAALRAAFSTQAASDILSNIANKVLLDAFMHVDASWREVAAVKPTNNFHTHTHYRLCGDMEYQQVGPTGELKHGTTTDEKYTTKADTYGRMFVITRQDIINDDLGAFDDLRQRVGRGGALKLNKLFWAAFLDNATFFTSARGNYAAGADTALDSASLSKGVEMFRKLKDSDKQLVGVAPRKLLVPPELETTADELYVSRNINTGGASTKTKVPNDNAHAGKYKPVISAYLSDSTLTGWSSTAWHLLADPQDVPVMVVMFLDGKQTPTVEGADADFNVLGIQVRGYHDFGVALAEWVAAIKMKGTA